MPRKSNGKSHENNPYRKRLRSWNKTEAILNHSSASISSADHTKPIVNNPDKPIERSTIYTYPINQINDQHGLPSKTLLSESSTSQSAFYCPSISNTTMRTTMNIDHRKRKFPTISCESIPNECSHIKMLDFVSHSNNENTNINSNASSFHGLRKAYSQYPNKKRSRLTTNDSNLAKYYYEHAPLPINDHIIDINQFDSYEPLPSSSSIHSRSLMNKANSKQLAIQMIQPIVDIIFTAFNDQLKTLQTKPVRSSFANHPIVLHTVNFNIQLTPKPIEVNFFNENTTTQSIPLNTLKEKLVSYVQTASVNSRTERKLKRFVQLSIFAVSLLCGYLLL